MAFQIPCERKRRAGAAITSTRCRIAFMPAAAWARSESESIFGRQATTSFSPGHHTKGDPMSGQTTRLNAAIELVHHSRKTNGAEVTVEDARGASAVVFATRDARAINTMTKQEADNAGVVNRRLHFRCESGKANLAPPPDKADWFQLMSIPLGNGDSATIDNGDKVAVVASWQYPNMLAGVTNDLTV